MSDNEDIFADAKLRMEQLWKQFALAPTVTLVGIVGPNGPSGMALGGSKTWTFHFSFECWRLEHQQVDPREMTLQMKVSRNDLKALEKQVTPYQVLKVKARLVHNAELTNPQAELVEIVGPTDDFELQQLSVKLQEPITFHDERFGVLTLDKRLNQYNADVTWNKCKITLSLETQNKNDYSSALACAKRLFDDEASWASRINNYAVEKLLGQTWLEVEDELKLTRDEFLSLMKLSSISISPDGQFDFWHDDGDLFFGHTIQVSGNLDIGPIGIHTPG